MGLSSFLLKMKLKIKEEKMKNTTILSSLLLKIKLKVFLCNKSLFEKTYSRGSMLIEAVLSFFVLLSFLYLLQVLYQQSDESIQKARLSFNRARETKKPNSMNRATNKTNKSNKPGGTYNELI